MAMLCKTAQATITAEQLCKFMPSPCFRQENRHFQQPIPHSTVARVAFWARLKQRSSGVVGYKKGVMMNADAG